jgi:peptide/nickel transport system substrate-binding protein
VSSEAPRARLWPAVGAATTLALMTLSVLAITGVVLSNVQEVSGERGGTLHAVSIDPVGELDPAEVQTAFAASLLRATDRTPYAFEPLRGIVPDLALGPPQISNDSRRLEIKIRAGVRFGPPVDRPVTADDIAYGIERGFLPSVGSGFAKLYFHSIKGVAAFRAGTANRISGLQTPDDHTLVFNLKQPTARVVASALTLPIAAPVPRGYASRFDRGSSSTYARHQVATGPYRFAPGRGGLIPGPSATRLSLVRNPNWNRDTDFRAAFVNRVQVVSAPGRGAAAHQVVRGRGPSAGGL